MVEVLLLAVVEVLPRDMSMRRLLAVHGTPGTGKSRFQELACELCGPPKTDCAKRVWSEFNKTNAKDPRLSEFRSNMRKRIPVPITFGDWQSGRGWEAWREKDWDTEFAIAARVIHR